MKNRKRYLALALLAAMLLASCNGGSTESTPSDDTTADTTANETETIAETEAETEAVTAASVLGKRDYAGAEFRILGREYGKLGDLPAMEFAVEGETGDIINDTIYRRNSTVSELMNVKITAEQGYAPDILRNAQQAGDAIYSLVWQHVNDMSLMVQSSLLSDYNAMPEIDITKPWWNQLATESLTLNGRCYLQMNYIPFTGVLLSHCLYFNQNIAEDNGITNIYDLVLNNKWDFDTFAAISKQVSRDVDGNGVYDENDEYGLIASHGTAGIGFAVAMGTKPIEVHSDGSFTLLMGTEQNQNILEKIVSLTSDTSTYLLTDYSRENELAVSFASGKALFYSGFLTDSYQFFRDMEDDFGLIPFPKYDTTQDKYITTVTGGTGLLGIPALLADREMTGAVTEALAIESLSRIYPAVYETVFNNKVLRDTESAKMFDLIMDGMAIDFGRTFKYGAYSDLIPDLVAAGSTDLASAAAAQETAAREHYQKIIDLYFQSEE